MESADDRIHRLSCQFDRACQEIDDAPVSAARDQGLLISLCQDQILLMQKRIGNNTNMPQYIKCLISIC